MAKKKGITLEQRFESIDKKLTEEESKFLFGFIGSQLESIYKLKEKCRKLQRDNFDLEMKNTKLRMIIEYAEKLNKEKKNGKN